MLHVIREHTGGEPINAETCYIIRDKFELHAEGIHGWLH